MTEREILEQLEKGTPFEGLKGITIIRTIVEPKESFDGKAITRPDVKLDIDFSGVVVTVFGEIKTQITPKILEQIGPWLARIKKLAPYILICPFLSSGSQKYCQENGIDFIDMSGNVFINIPGKIMIQKLERPNKFPVKQTLRNPFWGASSRVLRVLLQYPKKIWTISGVENELKMESERQKIDFKLSISSVSKTVQALDEELLIRRDRLKIIIPEPKQMLFRWAQKYKEMSRRTLTEGIDIKNPFSSGVNASVKELINELQDISSYVVTSSAAANYLAPYTNIDKIEIQVMNKNHTNLFGPLPEQESIGPEFKVSVVKDEGVFMYANEIEGVRIASDIQIYLDCYARGGRDLKQADYLLSNVIEKRWAKND